MGERLAKTAILTLLCAAPAWARTRELGFEERVEAQRAIERVYYAHQIGASLPFEQAVPEALIRQKVTTSLQESVALDKRWHEPLTAAELQRELDRIAAHTRFPERLLEIYEALGNDPVLVQECFVRPVLVERLARARFTADRQIHAAARLEAEALHRKLKAGAIDPLKDSPSRFVQEVKVSDGSVDESVRAEEPTPATRLVPPEEFARLRRLLPGRAGEVGPVEEQEDAYVVKVLLEEEDTRLQFASFRVPRVTWEEWWHLARESSDLSSVRMVAGEEAALAMPEGSVAIGPFPCALDDTWDNGVLDALPDPVAMHTAVWTGSVMVVWGGGPSNRGGRYDPTTDTWRSTSRIGVPSGRWLHTAVWTGQEMVVWGGQGAGVRGDGGRYDPVSDTWSPMTTANAPSPRYLHTAVWTGSQMIVWGGSDDVAYFNTGGAYDPSTDTWTPLSSSGAPVGRWRHTAVWTGDAMIIWGGGNGAPLGDGGVYRPGSDAWAPVSMVNAPEPREWHTAVWTGSRMVIWGGGSYDGLTYLNTGARYDPATGAWEPTTQSGAPPARMLHTAVWTGSRMIVWGGENSVSYFGTGAKYDPVSDTWAALSTVNRPLSRSQHTAVWTGGLMVIWGGATNYYEYNPPARYDPAQDVWLSPSSNYPPDGREGHRAVWTGNVMLVWGGFNSSGYIQGGARYDLLTDTWSPMTRLGEPHGRVSFTAVWSGQEMIIWGGYSGAPDPATWYNSGSRYDPIADSWLPITTNGAPVGRQDHTTVWTGREMIIWGGSFPTTFLNSGGSYDPNSDTWSPTPTPGAPLGRYRHTAVWSGREMIIWGGYNSGVYLNTGGRYDPDLDSWSPMTTVDAPPGRYNLGSIWTGSEMVVWGGYNGSYLNTGGRYDPALDRWLPTSLTGAPSARQNHAFVWTGSLGVVWGGDTGSTNASGGGRYDPILDSWTPVTTTNAARTRTNFSAVWTGRFIIVWGGKSLIRLYTGGRYIVAPALDHDADGVMVCEEDCDDADPSTYPGAPALCDGRNNDCSSGGWPSLAGTNEADDDGDLVSECQGDCDDSIATAWSTPDEVPDLTMRADGITLDWVPPASGGASSWAYDTLRTPAAGDFSGAATCVESDDGADLVAMDATLPAAGQILYYLVRAENACPGAAGIGPLGTRSDGTPRVGRICP